MHSCTYGILPDRADAFSTCLVNDDKEHTCKHLASALLQDQQAIITHSQRVMQAVLLLVLFVIRSAESLGPALSPALLFPRRGLSARVTRVSHLTRSGMSSLEPGNWLDTIDADSHDDSKAAFQTCMNTFSTMDDNEGELASEYAKAVASEAKWLNNMLSHRFGIVE